MKRVLVIGSKEDGGDLLKALQANKQLSVVAYIVPKAQPTQLAHHFNIPVDTEWKHWLDKDIDVVIESIGDNNLFQTLLKVKKKETVVIPAGFAAMIAKSFQQNEALAERVENQSLLLNHMRDGIVVINKEKIVQFANTNAAHILEIPKESLENHCVESVVNFSRLSNVLQTRKKEINQRLVLENGKTVITTRIPIVDSNQELVGAFSVFKDITEVRELAEENTDLMEVKKMLEAVIHSSEEAISVVDEHGRGTMINPAYTRITGLTEKDVIGQPATTDIFEGESMHMKVLQTLEPVRGARMKVGVTKKEVLVNVAPIIVEGQVKGSVGVLHDVSELEALTHELNRAKEIIRTLEAKYTFADIIGVSPELDLALQQAKVGAKTPATVLLRGESGAGKELFAHAIHNESDRNNHPFIRINCASIQPDQIETELFGLETHTDSKTGKKGLFEQANHGSIFLDEIGSLSMQMQAKLLRVLQENEIIRAEGTVPVAVNVRVITATNIDLEKAIMQQTFRKDLYYFLNRLPIFLPSLRERMQDIPVLAKHMMDRMNHEYGKNVHSISEEALNKLSTYSWPGNVRELENVIGRAMIYMKKTEQEIEEKHLPNLHIHSLLDETYLGKDRQIASLQQAMEDYEKEYISRVLKQYNYNKTKTAKALHISIRNLYYKMEKYHLENTL